MDGQLDMYVYITLRDLARGKSLHPLRGSL